MRYKITKMVEISAAHKLSLDYDSKCKELHGHNWEIKIHCSATLLDVNGMVIDFTVLKDIANEYDHTNLNDKIEQPTAENICLEILNRILSYTCNDISEREFKVDKITCQESEGNIACIE